MLRLLLAAVMALAFPAAAQAALYERPLASNAYITRHGLDWAWASACPPTEGCNDIDLGFQSAFGWRLPTAREFAWRPTAQDFVFPGANVGQGGVDFASWSLFGEGDGIPVDVGGDGACAATYFSGDNAFRECNWYDGTTGHIWDPGADYSQVDKESLEYWGLDTWVVRGELNVPEPASWALLITGFGLVGATLRRRLNSPEAAAALH